MNKLFCLFHLFFWLMILSPLTWAENQEPINCAESIILKPYQLPSYADEKWDSYCSRLFLKKYAPQGFITIFGVNRQLAEYKEDYQLIYEFAKKWSADKASLQLPIASGGGDGIMRAATLGAKEGRQDAKVLSLDVNIYSASYIPQKIDPQDIKQYTFIYRVMTKREADLIDYAQGVVMSVGGVGTIWEFVEALSKIHLRKKAPVPIIILSKKPAEYIGILQLLINKGLIANKMCRYVNLTASTDKAIALIKATRVMREQDHTNLCFALKR